MGVATADVTLCNYDRLSDFNWFPLGHNLQLVSYCRVPLLPRILATKFTPHSGVPVSSVAAKHHTNVRLQYCCCLATLLAQMDGKRGWQLNMNSGPYGDYQFQRPTNVNKGEQQASTYKRTFITVASIQLLGVILIWLLVFSKSGG